MGRASEPQSSLLVRNVRAPVFTDFLCDQHNFELPAHEVVCYDLPQIENLSQPLPIFQLKLVV